MDSASASANRRAIHSGFILTHLPPSNSTSDYSSTTWLTRDRKIGGNLSGSSLAMERRGESVVVWVFKLSCHPLTLLRNKWVEMTRELFQVAQNGLLKQPAKVHILWPVHIFLVLLSLSLTIALGFPIGWQLQPKTINILFFRYCDKVVPGGSSDTPCAWVNFSAFLWLLWQFGVATGSILNVVWM